MQIYIPNIGQQLTTLTDWQFTLYADNQNRDFIQKANLAEFFTKRDGSNFDINREPLYNFNYRGELKIYRDALELITIPAGAQILQ